MDESTIKEVPSQETVLESLLGSLNVSFAELIPTRQSIAEVCGLPNNTEKKEDQDSLTNLDKGHRTLLLKKTPKTSRTKYQTMVNKNSNEMSRMQHPIVMRQEAFSIGLPIPGQHST